jgi:flavin reductase (DIM6/NTAB) family NADH-FMN oxidoreductase RutF
VVKIGNSSGANTDKFAEFGLTAAPAEAVDGAADRGMLRQPRMPAADAALVDKYNFFVFEVVKAHVAKSPKYPRTIHYRGDGIFMMSGENTAKLPAPVPGGML